MDSTATMLAALVDQTTEAIATLDADARITYANAAAVALLGLDRAELIGSSVVDMVHPDDLHRALVAIGSVSQGAQPRPGMMRIRAHGDTWRLLEISPAPIVLPPGEHEGAQLTMVLLRDNLLQEAHWHFLAALSTGGTFAEAVDGFARGMSNTVDGPLAITFDEDGRRAVAGSLPASLAGIGDDGDADPTPGTPWAIALETGRASWCPVAELPPAVAAKAASIGAAACVVATVPDPASAAPVLLVQWPPTEAMAPLLAEALVRRPRQAMALALERRDALRRLEQLAHYDGLSGLANRERFFEALAEMDAAGQQYGICYVDLDRFKPVNDVLGHRAGDSVIEACGGRLSALCRPGDVAARLGGDEFALACLDVDDAALRTIADRIVATLSAPVALADGVVSVEASVGFALSGPTLGGDQVVAMADAAMYTAKHAGRQRSDPEPTVG